MVGAPGSGKGTQAAALSIALGVPAISTGDIFRDHVARETPVGLIVAAMMAAGDYVPDDVTNGLVSERLEEDDVAVGFILDGYPRTSEQVVELDRILLARGTRLDAIIHLRSSAADLLPRLIARAHEQGRADDTPETIRRRFERYTESTEPLLASYRDRSILIDVDGQNAVAEVTDSILRELARHSASRNGESA